MMIDEGYQDGGVSLNELIPWKTDIVPRFRSSRSLSTGTERPGGELRNENEHSVHPRPGKQEASRK